MMRIALVVLLFANVACRSTPPSDAAARDIERFVRETLREIPDFASVGVAIARDGKPYYAGACGYADNEAFTEPESARVELVPGSGEVLRFMFGNADIAQSVKWGDEVFQRVD